MKRTKRTVGNEQFYTDPHLAARCVAFADSLLALDTFAYVVEPSAGDGRFLEHLPRDRRTGLDLEPRHPEVERADFLTWWPAKRRGTEAILVIGNPPFGQRAALAVDFLEHACQFADAVAFILPRSFNKWTFQNRVPASFHLAGAMDCEDFTDPDGSPLTVKAVFQVWRREDRPRELIRLPTDHADFDMRHGHLSRMTEDVRERFRREYDFTIPQVGADFRPREVVDVVRGSHWFIRARRAGVREVFEHLDFDFLDGMNTAHKSLSKADIIQAYEQARAVLGFAVGCPPSTDQPPAVPSDPEQLPLFV